VWFVLGRRGVHAGFLAWNCERIDSTWMTKVVLKIALKDILKEQGDSLWTGFIRLRLGTSGRLLWKQ